MFSCMCIGPGHASSTFIDSIVWNKQICLIRWIIKKQLHTHICHICKKTTKQHMQENNKTKSKRINPISIIWCIKHVRTYLFYSKKKTYVWMRWIYKQAHKLTKKHMFPIHLLQLISCTALRHRDAASSPSTTSQIYPIHHSHLLYHVRLCDIVMKLHRLQQRAKSIQYNFRNC